MLMFPQHPFFIKIFQQHSIDLMAPASSLAISTLFLLLPLFSALPLYSSTPASTCRSYCGNITVDYPFAVHNGCGHPAFGQLLFCINGILLLHVPSGSYRVLSIDYAFRRMVLNDPTMSDCYSLGTSSLGFVANRWRTQYLRPSPDNVFFLLGCHHDSPLFQIGFSAGSACRREVSGMACEDYYRCPAWDAGGRARDSAYGAASSPPECCSVPAGVIREVNLTWLRCSAYSSAYSLAPLRPRGAGDWSYGIRVAYSLAGDDEAACRSCQVSGGACGFDASTGLGQVENEGFEKALPSLLCLCGGGGTVPWNSTSTCNSALLGSSEGKMIFKRASIIHGVLAGWLMYAGTALFAIL